MSRLLQMALTVATGVTLTVPAIAGVPQPVGIDAFSLVYDNLYRASVERGDLRFLPPVGPYFADDMRAALPYEVNPATLELTQRTQTGHLRLFSLTSQRLRGREATRSDDLFSMRGGARYQPDVNLSTWFMFNLNREQALDPTYSGHTWRGLAGDIESAGLYYRTGSFDFTLGRERVFWGPQRVNLILSETAEPLDILAARFHRGRIHFNFLFARLDQSRPDAVDSVRFPDRSFVENRYLVGHRLDLDLSRRLRIGLFETTLFGGEGRPPELYYLNPLQFFHAAQVNGGEDDNTILGADFTWLPLNGLSLYGQLLVDDFQVDDAEQGDQEPNEIGLMAGLYHTGVPGTMSPDVKIEYVRITNRTYHQLEPRNRYLYRNRLLGHPLGPDADSVSLLLRFWPTSQQAVDVELAHRRHGEGSIYAAWDQPWLETEGAYSESFPTGTVESANLVAIRYHGFLPFSAYTSQHLHLSLGAGYAERHHQGNIEGQDDTSAWFDISLSWFGFLTLDTGR